MKIVDEMCVKDYLGKDSYQRIKEPTKEGIPQLQTQISRLIRTDTYFIKYCLYSTSLLENLDLQHNQGFPYVRKLQKDLQKKKAERLDISDKTFGNVPMTGLEPALYC